MVERFGAAVEQLGRRQSLEKVEVALETLARLAAEGRGMRERQRQATEADRQDPRTLHVFALGRRQQVCRCCGNVENVDAQRGAESFEAPVAGGDDDLAVASRWRTSGEVLGRVDVVEYQQPRRLSALQRLESRHGALLGAEALDTHSQRLCQFRQVGDTCVLGSHPGHDVELVEMILHVTGDELRLAHTPEPGDRLGHQGMAAARQRLLQRHELRAPPGEIVHHPRNAEPNL